MKEKSMNEELENPNVLIVDDDRDFADSLADILEHHDYKTAIAENGKEAANIIKNFNAHVALLDIRLKHSNGIDQINILKKVRPELLCIMMTAYSSIETAIKALQHGAYDYLSKPINSHDLYATLNRCFEKIQLKRNMKNTIVSLQEKEEKYRTLIENVNIGIYRNTVVPKGKFLQVNPAIAKMFGYNSVDEIMNVQVSDLYQNPEDRKLFFKDLIRNGFVKNKELNLKKKDGSFIVGSCTAKIQYDEKGDIKWIDGSIEDITERKKAEEKLRESEERWRSLVQNIPDLIFSVSRELNILSLNQVIIDTTLDEVIGKNILDFVAPEYIENVRETVKKVFQTGEPDSYIILGTGAQGPNSSWYETRVIPVIKENTVTSTMLISTDITERKQAEDSLKKSEKRLREITENMFDMVSICDIEGIFQYISPSHKTILGYNPEDLLGKLSFDFVHKDDLTSVLAAASIGLETRSKKQLHIRFLCADGSYKWIESIGKYLLNEEGIPSRIIFSSRDISNRKHVEEALLRIEKAVESSSDAIGISDPMGNHIYQNKAFYDMFGYTRVELAAIGGSTSVYADQNIGIQVFNTIKSGNTWMGETEMISKNGRHFPVFLRTDAIKDDSGKIIGLIGLHTDITERKMAEESLQKSENNLKEAQRIAHVGSFDWDMATNEIGYSDEMYRLYGLVRDELPSKDIIEHINKSIHPDDKDYITKKIIETLSGQDTGPVEFRVIHPKGEIRTLYGESIITKDSNGKPIRLIGTVLDVTERKQAEDKLKEMSIKDDLTGLYNRRGFFTLAEQQLQIASRSKKGIFLFFLDMDDMKQINDTLGHHKGDQALIETANILEKSFRKSDIIARIGGDEFVVLASESPAYKTEILIKRLENNINTLNQKTDRPYELSVSLGIAYYDPKQPCSLDNLLTQADSQMYEQKRNKIKV